MTNYPADIPEDHAAPRHAGALADDRDEPAGLHEARPADSDLDDADGDESRLDGAYSADGDASPADGDADSEADSAAVSDADDDGYGAPVLVGAVDDDPDVIVVGETDSASSATGDDQLADPSAGQDADAFAVDSSGAAEPVDSAGPDAATPADFTAAGSSPVDGESADGDPADAGPVDTGPVDTSSVDTSPVDTSTVDTSTVDSSTVDTSTADAGTAATSATASAPPAGPPQVADPAGSDATAFQERWLAIQSDFVDDPHRSVSAAAELVEGTIASVIADIKQRESSLRDSWDGSSADTEVLRKALVDYRSFLDKLAAI